MEKFDVKKLENAINFTEAYKKYENEHIAIREAMCLKAQYPAILLDIQDKDLFAGRFDFPYVGFRYSFLEGDTGYLCNKFLIAGELEKDGATEEYKKKYNEIIDFWEDKTPIGILGANDRYEQPPEINNGLLFPNEGQNWQVENILANYTPRLAEININFDKLLKLGIPGMNDLIRDYLVRAKEDGIDSGIYDGMLIALDSFSDICRYYAGNARVQAVGKDDARRKELIEMADVLDRIASDKPETFREAIQLMWLYSIVAYVDNFGRMDIYLGDFYCKDIDSGKITEDEALGLLDSLYTLINGMYKPTGGRIILGGKGRSNVKNADRFALLAMEAIGRYHWESDITSPQVTLRIYKGIDCVLYDKAMDTIRKGSTYPFMFNDDVNIPEIAAAFNVSENEAEQYVMSNCGEFCIDHRSYGSPNVSVVYPKLFEVTLNNGYDPVSGKEKGFKTGEFTEFKTFEEFYETFLRNVEFYVEMLADKAAEVYKITAKSSCDLYSAMLFDGCLEKGKGFLSGAQYLGLDVETHGLICVADSMTTIKSLVFEEKVITAETMLKALKMNFAGYEYEMKMMRNAPKFGNNNDYADNMALNLFTRVHDIISKQAGRLRLHFCVSSNISVDAYYFLGQKLGATPDGRMAGKPFTNSFNPLPGNDKSGITALLNSMVKIKPGHSGGQANHLKLNSDMFTTNRRFTDALLETYFENGGAHICIEALNRKDLENAFKEPEKYPNLMVRVGGFSARFVTLPRDFQLDILSRTQY